MYTHMYIHIYIHTCMYIYIYICIHISIQIYSTYGFNTNGAAVKVISFDRLGKKVGHGTFGKIKVG